MSNVRHLPRSFDVQVKHDAQSGMWWAVCDGLVLATEAPSYEALTARVWLIAPEMAQENGLNIQPEDLRLRFVHEQAAAPTALAL